MTILSDFSTKYVESNKYWFNMSSQSSTINRLSAWKIVLQANLQETYVNYLRTSLQRTEKYHRFILTILKKKWQKCIMNPSLQYTTFQQYWRPSIVWGHCRMSLFGPSGNLQGLYNPQQDRKVPRVYQVLESSSYDPENVNFIKNDFLQNPSRTHQDRIIDPQTSQIRES